MTTDITPGAEPAPWNVILHSTEGGADKIYELHLQPNGELWDVNYRNGRRGGTMKPGSKNANGPLTYDEARKTAIKELKAKLGKGYNPIGGTSFSEDAVAQGITLSGREDTGYRPQLLNFIGNDDVERLIADPNWIMEIKYNGERRGISIGGETPVGSVRKGNAVALGAVITAAAASIDRKVELDGEQIGDRYHCWDVLSIDGVDLRGRPLLERKKILTALDIARPGTIHVVKHYATTAEKRAAFEWARDNRIEGVVFKHKDATYEPNRPNSGGTWVKYKFWQSLTAIATPNSDRRSAAIHVLDADGGKIPVGNVTIPPNEDMPASGDVIEVQYLYANLGGSLEQPVFLGKRGDMDASDCREDQRFYKPEPEAEVDTPSFGM